MSPYFYDGLAVLLCLISSIVFYLGCPNQQWMSRKLLGFYPMLSISLALLCIAWWIFNFHLSALSTTFALLTVQMFFLGLIPFLSRFDKPQFAVRGKKSGIEKYEDAANYKAQWWLRIVGIILLCYPLSVGLSGLYGLVGPGEITNNVKSQFVMWMITPLWLTPLSLIFFSRKIVRFFLILLSLNGLVFLLLWLARSGG